MKVTIELFEGPHHGEPTQDGMQDNIDSLRRILSGKQTCSDFIRVEDTISILEVIKELLPKRHRSWP